MLTSLIDTLQVKLFPFFCFRSSDPLVDILMLNLFGIDQEPLLPNNYLNHKNITPGIDSQRSPMRSFGNESCPGSDDELMDSNEYSDDTYIETILQEMTPSRKISTKETFMISLYF